MLDKLLKSEITTLNKIQEFLNNEEGAETMEYVVIVAIIVILGGIAYKAGMGTVISDAFSKMTGAITTAGG